jgi:hypothetical protein
MLHAQNVTASRVSAFLTGVHHLLVTSKGRPVFPSTTRCATVSCKLHRHYRNFVSAGANINVQGAGLCVVMIKAFGAMFGESSHSDL